MGDFLLELLFLFAEVIFALFEFALEAAFDLIFRAIAEVFEISELNNPLLACAGYILLGGATGGLSLLLYPHSLFHPSHVHGISLLGRPILTGLAMWQVGSLLRRKNKKVIRIESFGTDLPLQRAWLLLGSASQSDKPAGATVTPSC
jgi:hypothetical protein